MSQWILTANGNEIDLAYPRPQAMVLADVAHSLAQINLGGDAGKATTLTLDAESVSHFGQVGLVDTGIGASHPVQMVVKGDQAEGRFFLHQGDDSSFTAVRQAR